MRHVSEDEYDKNEGVRTLVNSIALLRAAADNEYTFWSAFYKFAIDHEHRVLTAANYKRLKLIEEEKRQRDVSRAAENINKMSSSTAQKEYEALRKLFAEMRRNPQK